MVHDVSTACCFLLCFLSAFTTDVAHAHARPCIHHAIAFIHDSTLGSDFSTWWAGAICAALGLLTMTSKHGPSHSLAANSRTSTGGRICNALYVLLAMGAAAAIIVALFFDLRLLDGLNKADVCAASTDNLVLDNGIVLTQTMGASLSLSVTLRVCERTMRPPPPGRLHACIPFFSSS